VLHCCDGNYTGSGGVRADSEASNEIGYLTWVGNSNSTGGCEHKALGLVR